MCFSAFAANGGCPFSTFSVPCRFLTIYSVERYGNDAFHAARSGFEYSGWKLNVCRSQSVCRAGFTIYRPGRFEDTRLNLECKNLV